MTKAARCRYEELRRHVAEGNSEVALRLLEEARHEVSPQDMLPLEELIEDAWGRALLLVGMRLDCLSSSRAAALVQQATSRRNLSTAGVAALQPRGLLDLLRQSVDPSSVICGKALAWGLDHWAVCEYISSLYEGNLCSLTSSPDIAPRPAELQSALGRLGFGSLALDLPWVFNVGSKNSIPVEMHLSSIGSSKRASRSAETLVEDAIAEAVDHLGTTAIAAILSRRYAQLSPGRNAWRRTGALPASMRWVTDKPKPVGPIPPAAPTYERRPSRRLRGLRGVPLDPLDPDGRGRGDRRPRQEARRPKRPDRLLLVDEVARFGNSAWSDIRWSTSPDRAQARVALAATPVRLLLVHAAERQLGERVLGAMLRLDLLGNDRWWVDLADAASDVPSPTSLTAAMAQSLMSKKRLGGAFEASSRVVTALPGIVALVRQAACLEIADSTRDRYRLAIRGQTLSQLEVSTTFAIVALCADRTAKEGEAPPAWSTGDAGRIRFRPRVQSAATGRIGVLAARSVEWGQVAKSVMTAMGADVLLGNEAEGS